MSMSAQVETYFDPDDGLEERVGRELGLAKTSIWIQAYKFSSEALVETLLRLKHQNPDLDLRLALDAAEASSARDKRQGRLVERIRAAGGEVRYVSDADKAHSKFIVIDSSVVLTGSFNFRRHADRVQRDNVVVMRSPEVAQTYAAKFEETLTSDQVTEPSGEPAADRSAARRQPRRTRKEAPASAWRANRPALVSGAALLLILSLLGVFSADRIGQAFDGDDGYEFVGPVESLPPDGLIGNWRVGGRTVQVTDGTEIQLAILPPPLGLEVEVEGAVLPDGSITADEIELQDGR
jgi:hypothetical protein